MSTALVSSFSYDFGSDNRSNPNGSNGSTAPSSSVASAAQNGYKRVSQHKRTLCIIMIIWSRDVWLMMANDDSNGGDDYDVDYDVRCTLKSSS